MKQPSAFGKGPFLVSEAAAAELVVAAYLGSNTNADGQVRAVRLAIGHLGIGINLEFAVNCGVLVDLKCHALGSRHLLRKALTWACGRRRHVDRDRRFIKCSDFSRSGLRLSVTLLLGDIRASARRLLRGGANRCGKCQTRNCCECDATYVHGQNLLWVLTGHTT